MKVNLSIQLGLAGPNQDLVTGYWISASGAREGRPKLGGRGSFPKVSCTPVKLCRFELRSTPGEVKTGIVHGGKIYETDGANPIGVHEAADVRPLPPVGQPPALRFFRFSDADLTLSSETLPLYFYGNPTSLIGASQIVPSLELTSQLDFEPYLAIVVALQGTGIPVEQGDGYILGYTILNALVMRDIERAEARAGSGPGRSRDYAMALGPVLTTPEELDDDLVDESQGRKHKLSVATRVNGVERGRGDTEDLPFSFAQLISIASETSMLRAGDIIAAGPLVRPEESFHPLEPGDEIQVAIEKLGTLSTKIE
jgi:2-keto-4-pentenoate hydratase/2-oxohepta-3-ene-1,7-dioic acid hydratase in catechol pathway